MSWFARSVRVIRGLCWGCRQLVQVLCLSVARGARAACGVARVWPDVPDEVEVRVWDSNSEVRYMVLPEQPAQTEHLSVEELATLVTRDAMIGVAKVDSPQETAQPSQ